MKADGNPRILVVEDEPDTADVLKQLLELKSSAEVEIAESLQVAREKIQSAAYDLITLDYQLSDGLGLELLSEITSSEAHPPVIMVTGRGDEEVASLAFQRGAAGYIVKNDKLLATLPQAVDKALRDFVLTRAVEAVRESEAFYHTLFDESADGLFIETLDGVIEDVNQAGCKMLGYSVEALKGKSAVDIVPPSRKKDFEDAVASLLEGAVIEFENVTRDGRVIPVEVGVKEVITRRGPRYVVSVRDVTERKEAQREISNGRAFTVDALDAIPDIFVISDLDGSFNRWNKTLCEVTGYADEEIEGMRTAEFFSADDYARLLAALKTVAQSGSTERLELQLITKDGLRIPYELTGSLLRDSDGNPSGIAGLGRDASDRKRSEAALRNVIKETNERREEITALLESTRLVLEHKEFEEAARAVFDLCWKLVGADAGFVSLLDTESGESNILFIEPESLRESMDAFGHMPVDKLNLPAFASGKSVYENDFQQTPWASSIPESHLQIENILFAPLLIEGKPAGMIAFANKPGGFNGRDALMTSAFGEVASVALRNSRTLELLRSSEERFRNVAESAHESIICADGRVDIIFWNAGAEQIFGYSAEEMLGKPLTSILPERFRVARLQSMLREAERDAAPSRIFEMIGLRKDETEFPMELSRSTWKAGGETNYAVIIRDVAERRKAEDVLREKEELYRTLLHASPDAVTVIDLKGGIVDVSRQSAAMYGYDDPDELKGMSAIAFVAEYDRERVREATRETLEEGAVRNLEVNLLKKDGSTFIGEASSALLRGRDGNPRGFIDVVRDITERKRAEHELQVLNNELEGYAHLVSHDLKGPLSTLIAAGMALRGILKAEWHEQAVQEAIELSGIIESNVRKSIALIDDLLELAEASQKPWEVGAVDIEDVVKRVVSERADIIREKGVRIRVDTHLGHVVSNPTHMYQLFSNLIANAIKHNDNPRPEITISSLGRTEAGLRSYRVRDNGSGIDEASVEKIFLPFFSGKSGETGIGLATVEKIVNVYNGSIKAYNDGGAVFEFTLKDYR
jgi:PAS domain S-box-containing protein